MANTELHKEGKPVVKPSGFLKFSTILEKFAKNSHGSTSLYLGGFEAKTDHFSRVNCLKFAKFSSRKNILLKGGDFYHIMTGVR